jgi:hypothetical protein
MAKWEELNMADRAAYMRIAVKNGYRDIRSIREAYNKYEDGGDKQINNGYLDYMEKLATKKAKDWNENTDIVLTQMLNDNTYNYEAFYNNDRKKALSMLTEDPEAHFLDIGKTVYHPTFSDQSIYSGKVSEYNPRGTIGGRWKNNEYVPSASQIRNKDFNWYRTNEYLTRDGSGEYISPDYKDL